MTNESHPNSDDEREIRKIARQCLRERQAGKAINLKALREQYPQYADRLADVMTEEYERMNAQSAANQEQNAAILLQMARDFIRKHDYEQAVDLLKSVSADQQSDESTELLYKAVALRNETRDLEEKIEKALNTGQTDGLERNIHRLLEISPNNKLARKLWNSRSSGDTFGRGKGKLRGSGRGLAKGPKDDFLIRGAAVFVLVFCVTGLIAYLYLSGEDRPLTVAVDTEWANSFGQSLTLDIDGTPHTLSGPTTRLRVPEGEHDFSVKDGNTYVHTPKSFEIGGELAQTLTINAEGMTLNAKTSVPKSPEEDSGDDENQSGDDPLLAGNDDADPTDNQPAEPEDDQPQENVAIPVLDEGRILSITERGVFSDLVVTNAVIALAGQVGVSRYAYNGKRVPSQTHIELDFGDESQIYEYTGTGRLALNFGNQIQIYESVKKPGAPSGQFERLAIQDVAYPAGYDNYRIVDLAATVNVKTVAVTVVASRGGQHDLYVLRLQPEGELQYQNVLIKRNVAANDDTQVVYQRQGGAFVTATTDGGKFKVFRLQDFDDSYQEKTLDVAGPGLFAASKDGIVVGSSDGTLHLFDGTQSLNLKKTIPVPDLTSTTHVAASKTGTLAAIYGDSANGEDWIYVVDVASGELVNKIPAKGQGVRFLSIKDNGSRVVWLTDQTEARVATIVDSPIWTP